MISVLITYKLQIIVVKRGEGLNPPIQRPVLKYYKHISFLENNIGRSWGFSPPPKYWAICAYATNNILYFKFL